MILQKQNICAFIIIFYFDELEANLYRKKLFFSTHGFIFFNQKFSRMNSLSTLFKWMKEDEYSGHGCFKLNTTKIL